MLRQGGTYIFIKHGLGAGPAFIYITTRVLLLNPASSAVQALAAAEYLLAPLSACPPRPALQLAALALLGLMTALHCSSTTATARLNTAITGLKLASLAAVVVAGLYALLTRPLPPPLAGTTTSLSPYITAVYGGYWSYAGWQGIPAAMEDVEEPRRTVPAAILLGLATVTITYCAVNFAFVCVLSVEEVSSSLRCFVTQCSGCGR